MERLLDRKEVSARIGLSISRIYALMAEGGFPRLLRLGKQARRWRESDIDEWIDGLPVADTDEWQSPNKPKSETVPSGTGADS